MVVFYILKWGSNIGVCALSGSGSGAELKEEGKQWAMCSRIDAMV